MPYMSIQQQAKYVDSVTRGNVQNPLFLEGLMDEISSLTDKELILNTNATGIGNLAYIALHASIAEVRAKASQVLARYKLLMTR